VAQDAHRKKSQKIKPLIETAQDLFYKYGIKRVSVEEICKKANVSKMTFYKYFPNKTELLRHVWEGWIDEGCRALDEIDAQDIPLPDKIQKMFEWKSDFLAKISEVLIEDIQNLDLGYEKSINRFLEFIMDAQKRGEIRADIRPEFLMTVLDKLYELGKDKKLRSLYPNVIVFHREIKNFFWYGVIADGNKENP
jgi:AcrR family transcriptional regulator